MTWTHFVDNAGESCLIVIEAPKEEAVAVFFSRFGRTRRAVIYECEDVFRVVRERDGVKADYSVTGVRAGFDSGGRAVVIAANYRAPRTMYA